MRIAPRPLSTALQSLTETISPATTLARVQVVWEPTVGPLIAAAARPTAERNGILTITCDAAVWAQELAMLAGELVPTLNHALTEDAIRELRCRTG